MLLISDMLISDMVGIGHFRIGSYKVNIFNDSLTFFDSGARLIDIVQPTLFAPSGIVITQQ